VTDEGQTDPQFATEEQRWDCLGDPSGNLERMFVGLVQTSRIRQGQWPAKRPVFLKPHGVAHGRFEIVPDLPDDLKVGVFGLGTLTAWVRFSSDTLPTDPDVKTTCGVGIKLFGVPGVKLLGNGSTHDFLLQNHDVFFVDTAVDMCEFTRAGVVDGDYNAYLETHHETDRILKEMKKVEQSVLTATYWSALPYAYGEDRFVKYKLEPVADEGIEPPFGDPDYLATDLGRRLLAGPASFRFMVQFRTRPGLMPLDRATVPWSEQDSPPVHVATLVLPRQDIAGPGQVAYGENLAFNPWHALGVHAPQGSISEVRRTVYAASANLRRDVNGTPSAEPSAPRPEVVVTEVADTLIVKAAIHPAIGVARVGNSPDQFFLGPEVPEPLPAEPDSYRDGEGRLKRQAARFRVYGLNAAGQAVAELDASNAEVTWTVHLANKKASWYQFQLALDIPEAVDAPPSLRRNARVDDRASLEINPGPRTITGPNAGGPAHVFGSGTFVGKPVYLGELRTDDVGRLVVLGGRGVSASSTGARAVTFANNEDWHDDVSDGPVTARVELEGRELAVEPAWVVVAPPNYAPTQKSVRTMYDLLSDVFISAGTLPAPVRPSFDRDIRPILERMTHLQWVNAGFAAAFGFGAPTDLSSPDRLSKLTSNDPGGMEMRRTIANQFRTLTGAGDSPSLWPWLYGDAMSIPPVDSPRQYSVLTGTQLRLLGQWVIGDCLDDYDPGRQPARRIEDLPTADQPAALTRAALDFCLADAFHPGCEMTWPMRTATMYMAPYRIAHRQPGWVEPDFGFELTADVTSLPDGPLAAQEPGGVSRWMAVPWQCDTASCRSGYDRAYDPYVPSFWPARVPNEVLTRHDYDTVVDQDRPLEERLAAFARRSAWIRPLGAGTYTDQINSMARDIGQMGVVVSRPGKGGGGGSRAGAVEPRVLPGHDGGGGSPRPGPRPVAGCSGGAGRGRADRSERHREGPTLSSRPTTLVTGAAHRGPGARGRPRRCQRGDQPRPAALDGRRRPSCPERGPAGGVSPIRRWPVAHRHGVGRCLPGRGPRPLAGQAVDLGTPRGRRGRSARGPGRPRLATGQTSFHRLAPDGGHVEGGDVAGPG
jgi:hypothetical protein